MKKYLFLFLILTLVGSSLHAQQKYTKTSLARILDTSGAFLYKGSNRDLADYSLAIHTNLLYDLALIPNIGVEWRISSQWGAQVNMAWTHIDWDDNNKHYRLWNVSPEIRYYFGEYFQVYTGAMFHTGAVNFKFKNIGKQGDVYSGGILLGYVVKLSSKLNLDLGLGLGYTRFNYDTYTSENGCNLCRETDLQKNYWGPTKLNATLVWKLN